MFNFFKSTENLERELRQWVIDDSVFRLGIERNEAQEFINDLDIKEVLKKVAETAYYGTQTAKMMRALSGATPSAREQLFFLKGIKLVQDFAKRKGWKVRVNGSPLMGSYQCEISGSDL